LIQIRDRLRLPLSVANYRAYRSNKAFEDARKAFIATLSLKDGANLLPCSSPDEIIATLKDLERASVQNEKRSLHRSFAVVKKLNDRLRPYFDALNALASAHTTAALTYGAFRTVLQVRLTGSETYLLVAQITDHSVAGECFSFFL
jgi:hypothetical protein